MGGLALKGTGRAALKALPAPMSMDDFVHNLLYMYGEDMGAGQSFVSDDGFFNASADAVALTAYWTLKENPKATNVVPRFDLFAKAITATVLAYAMSGFFECVSESYELCRTLSESPYVQGLVLADLGDQETFCADAVVRRLEPPWGWYKLIDPYSIEYDQYSKVVPIGFVTDEYVLALADGIKRFNNESTEAEVWAFR